MKIWRKKKHDQKQGGGPIIIIGSLGLPDPGWGWENPCFCETLPLHQPMAEIPPQLA